MDDIDAEMRFTASELKSWSALATLLQWLPAQLDAQLQRQSGMSHFEYGILYALLQAESGSLRMSTLASYATSTLSRLSRAVVRLEQRGWVSRHPDPDDGRITQAAITVPGRSAVLGATPGHVRFVRSLVFEPLSQNAAQQLGEYSARITVAGGVHHQWTPNSGI